MDDEPDGVQGVRWMPLAAISVVRAVSGNEIVIEAIGAHGGTGIVTLPAVLHTTYAAGDRVLVVFQSADAESGVVAGRIGNDADQFSEADFLRADGTRALAGNWDIGAAQHIAADEVRARAAGGLRIADAAGNPGVHVADGGNVGIGHAAPAGPLHVWDGVAGHLFASRSAIGAAAQELIAPGVGAVSTYLRVDAAIDNGTTRAFLAFALQVGGATTQNMVTGSDTFQFRLHGNGSVDVRRTAGGNPGDLMIRMMWM